MWKNVRLSEVATVIAGQSPKSEDFNNAGIGTPFYQGKKDYGEKYLNPPTVWTTKITKLAKKNDILISVRAPVGALNIANQKICIGRGLAAIRASVHVLDEYLFYALLQISSRLQGSSGAIFNSINKKQLEEIEFLLPPISEQERITKKLNEVFAGIDKVISYSEKVIQLSELVITQQINDYTNKKASWGEFKISDLGLVQTGNTPQTTQLEYYGTDIPFVKPPHFNTDGSISIVENGLSKQGANYSRIASENSILMVCIGTMGKVGICKENVCFNQQINALTPNHDCDAEFIYWQMRGKRFQGDLWKHAGQTTLPIVSKSKWQNLLIYLPPSLNEQIAIREKLRALSNEIDNYVSKRRKIISQLVSFKSAILSNELQSEES